MLAFLNRKGLRAESKVNQVAKNTAVKESAGFGHWSAFNALKPQKLTPGGRAAAVHNSTGSNQVHCAGAKTAK